MFSCATSDNPYSQPDDTGVSDDKVLIGTHTDLTGPIALYGVESVHGARMRFEEANDAGGVHGRQIEFIVEDSVYQVPRSLQAANKLINFDEIFVMFLALGTPNNNAVITKQFEAGVPNLFPLTGARSMVEPFQRLMLTQRGIYYDEIRAAVKYFAENHDKTVPCVIYHDTDYGFEIYEAAQDQAAEMGLEIGATSAHKTNEIDFTAAVIKMRSADCDLVLLGTVVRDTMIILETKHKMGWENAAWVGNNAAAGLAVAQVPDGSSNGYYAFNHMSAIYPDTETREFSREWHKRFVDQFNAEPDVAAMEGYRGADLIIRAMEQVGPDLTRTKLIAALETFSDYTGPFGYHLSFSPTEHKGVSESVLVQVQNGRWVKLEERITY